MFITECSAKVPRQHIVAMSLPSRVWWRLVPSAWWPERRCAPLSHRFCLPLAQDGQRPQEGMNEVTTWSPTASSVTPGPTSITTPAPSWPRMIGYCCQPSISTMAGSMAMSPVTMCSSEWHMPLAVNFTRTSPALGGSSSISSITYSV
jgi:hypothetical protein